MTEQPAEPAPPAEVRVGEDGAISLVLAAGQAVQLTESEAEVLAGQLLRSGKVHTYATFDDAGIATWHSNQHPVLVARALFALGQSLARGVYGAPVTTNLDQTVDRLADEIQAHLAEQAKPGDQP